MNNNTDIFEKNSKENYIKNLNASNEAKRLENKIKVNLNNNSYINNNNSKNNNSYIKNNNDSKNKNSMLKLSTPKHKPSGTNNSTLTNKIAKTGLQAAGVPKPFADIAVNSEIGQKTISRLKKKNFALNMFDRLTQGSDIKKKEELESNGGNTSFSFSRKEKRSIGIASLVFIGVIFVFCGLFITSSTVYLNAVGFGGADSLKGKDVEDKINKKSDNVDEDIANQDDVAFDIFIDNSDSLKFSKSKLDSSNLIKTKKVTEDILKMIIIYIILKKIMERIYLII